MRNLFSILSRGEIFLSSLYNSGELDEPISIVARLRAGKSGI
jgi:hypothetical protein